MRIAICAATEVINSIEAVDRARITIALMGANGGTGGKAASVGDTMALHPVIILITGIISTRGQTRVHQGLQEEDIIKATTDIMVTTEMIGKITTSAREADMVIGDMATSSVMVEKIPHLTTSGRLAEVPRRSERALVLLDTQASVWREGAFSSAICHLRLSGST